MLFREHIRKTYCQQKIKKFVGKKIWTVVTRQGSSRLTAWALAKYELKNNFKFKYDGGTYTFWANKESLREKKRLLESGKYFLGRPTIEKFMYLKPKQVKNLFCH